MSGTVRIPPGKLGAVLRQTAKDIPVALRGAMVVAAEHGRADLVAKSPTNTGVFRNAWEVKKGGESPASLDNSCPYAGIIERGARPHAVSQEGIESITEWAMAKLGLDEKEAKAAAYGIAKKLEAEGQQGLFLVRDNLPALRKYLAEESAAAVARVCSNPRIP